MKWLLLFLIPLISGCFCPEFVNVVQDHKILTNETILSVISTIEDEMDTEKDNLSEEERQSIESLLERLHTIIRQSNAIERYVMFGADKEIIAELLRSKWENNYGISEDISRQTPIRANAGENQEKSR